MHTRDNKQKQTQNGSFSIFGDALAFDHLTVWPQLICSSSSQDALLTSFVKIYQSIDIVEKMSRMDVHTDTGPDKQQNASNICGRRHKPKMALLAYLVVLKFHLLTPPNQFTFVPRYTVDKSLVKIYQRIPQISWKKCRGCTHGHTPRWTT